MLTPVQRSMLIAPTLAAPLTLMRVRRLTLMPVPLWMVTQPIRALA